MVTEILLGVTVLLNIVLLVGIRNLNRQNEQYQDYIEDEITKLSDVKERVGSALQRMRAADIRGSFESDDEVGASFKELLSIIEQLEQDI